MKMYSQLAKKLKHINSPNTTAKGKSVPWWTHDLKIRGKGQMH